MVVWDWRWTIWYVWTWFWWWVGYVTYGSLASWALTKLLIHSAWSVRTSWKLIFPLNSPVCEIPSMKSSYEVGRSLCWRNSNSVPGLFVPNMQIHWWQKRWILTYPSGKEPLEMSDKGTVRQNKTLKRKILVNGQIIVLSVIIKNGTIGILH